MEYQLTDLDELLSGVKNLHSKGYLKEAIVSYRAGAYRAAVTSTWIAICVDVIQKILELANTGDPEAIKLKSQLDNINSNNVAGMLSFEKDILKVAQEDLEIISLIERTQLERIQFDRNICAHPTFSPDGVQFVPKSELVRAYIVMAGNYLLCVSPVNGKAILDIIYTFINSNSFPDDENKAFNTLNSERYLGRVKSSVFRNLFIMIFKRIFRDDKVVSEALMRNMMYSISTIERLNHNIYKDVSKEKFIPLIADAVDDNFERLFRVLYYKPELWQLADDAIKNRLEQLLKNMNVNSLLENKVNAIVDLTSDMTSSFLYNINRLDFNNKKLIYKALPCKALALNVVDLFIESSSFNEAFNNGLILLEYSQYFTDELLNKTLNGTLDNSAFAGINQIIWATGIDDILSNLYNKTKKSNVSNHSSIWIKFRGELEEKGANTTKIDQLMTDDGLITISE
ncbi:MULTISPECIES: hypothetical protein [Providencia]|uniref:Uncharacterized protein n=1 Tax=Providencia rettgeri TaxID=587 RepID=A0AB35LCL3_PRORE|nr:MULTISPECIES: hypothetical protein [Providencia]MDH2306306.1 hypothetical protein [Providencia rettgeri]